VTLDFDHCVRELSIAEHVETMEVEGKGKEKLVANDDTNDLEKSEEYNSEAEAAKDDEMNQKIRND